MASAAPTSPSRSTGYPLSPGSSPGSHPLALHIRVHHLNDGEHLESILFRLNKGWSIQFKLGSTLFGKKVKLYINYQDNPEVAFNRYQYKEVPWRNESINSGDDTALFANVTFHTAGCFHYFFILEGGNIKKPNGSGYLLVDPVLNYGPDDDVLPLDSVQCQTFLAKCLGPFNEWEQRLITAKEAGYNMVHITPIQELGKSLSSYSLQDQLNLNSMFSTKDTTYTLDDVAALIEKMRTEWKVLSITDVVLNHSANESKWLYAHPECTYNLINSPHLRPAYLLDRALWYLTSEIAAEKWTFSGIPHIIEEEQHLEAIRAALHGYFLPQVKIHELFMVNIEILVDEFRKCITTVKREIESVEENQLQIIQDPDYKRFGSRVDMNLALHLYDTSSNDSTAEADVIESCCGAFRQKLKELNDGIMHEIQIHLNAAVENVLKAVKYERLQSDGPKLKEVSKKFPLVPQYFTPHGPDANLEEDEKLMYSSNACHIMAHNGWVMGDNPLKNFAEPGSNVYLRRELIAWGDSVKLRYGKVPEDCPFLWEHMTKYVQQMSRIFHGLRLDNCHSTPIHVAEYLMDKARLVRPDLYIIAELFTSSEGIDNVFVNRLGISSLVREAMSAPDAHEQGRLVYRYGGEPVGAFIQPVIRPLTRCIAHAIFMDVTHDNPSPIQTRSVYDLFPTAALVSMACCSTGSTKGYDELVPHHIHVVDENRFYPSWTTNAQPMRGFINIESGIIAGKRAVNRLHQELGAAGFSQVYVDQKDENIIAVTRHCPATHQSIILVARTSFRTPSNPRETSFVPPLTIPGIIDEIIFEARLLPVNHAGTSLGPSYSRDEHFINGLADFQLHIKENLQLYESDMVEVTNTEEDGSYDLDFVDFPPGSVVVFRVSLDATARSAILKIRTCVSQFGYRMRSYSGSLIRRQGHDFETILSYLTLSDLNIILFSCDAEEKDQDKSAGAYHIPNYGNLMYCGLQGVMSELMSIHLNNDLGHPFCDNLRQGDWLPRYLSNRLMKHPRTRDLGQWFHGVFIYLSQIPRYLIPCYFDTIITGAYSSLLSSVWRKMSDFVSEGSTFVKALALGSVILGGIVESANLPQLSPNLIPPLPPTISARTDEPKQSCITLAAGFPHFAVEYMRNWGRDTFISLRGLFLITGRYQEARYIILAYAACLRHGLIPNLLDGGIKARFNCRDAVWWWLQCIQEYTKMAPEGHTILNDKVSRLFPTDDSFPQSAGTCDQPLYEVIQEAVQRHFQGVEFRERNAGFNLDSQMSDKGFNNMIGVNLKTGFVYGGNEHNCGTWMDKMGSSEKAGNKSKPATPRDGSAVELVGLCKSSIRWLYQMFLKGYYPYNSVEKLEPGSTTIMSFLEWEILIENNFERCFWINTEPSPDESTPDLIHKRGIYKDSYYATQFWADYQFRPNFTVAMVVAPELFTPENAWTALENAEKTLLGPLGMKTLDPDDWSYNGYYNNSDDSFNENIAKGFNYHQGPEWIWPVGYFLRAKLRFANLVGGKAEFMKTVTFTKKVLSQHFKEIQNSKWRGLPELTNKDGEHCPDSCPIQAWSHASLLEVLYDMDKMCPESELSTEI